MAHAHSSYRMMQEKEQSHSCRSLNLGVGESQGEQEPHFAKKEEG